VHEKNKQTMVLPVSHWHKVGSTNVGVFSNSTDVKHVNLEHFENTHTPQQ